MKTEPNSFAWRLQQLVGEYIEVLLKNEKIILGKLLSVEERSMNAILSSSEGTFFIRGDAIVAIKKGESALE